jgi:hypothetical protein
MQSEGQTKQQLAQLDQTFHPSRVISRDDKHKYQQN